jgi:NADPH2:quinone reductase
MLWEELPEPVPGAGQLRVRVHASGVNFAETRMRAGTYSGIELPFVMGMEGAGVVEAMGDGVTGFAPGQRAFGRARGCHAQQVLFDAAHLMPMPDELDFVQAAAIPVGWLTAWHALHTVARIRPGQRVLVEAVAGSVGSAALQIAKQHGCWVTGTASRDDKLERAREFGADLLVNYTRDPVSEAVHAATDGRGADVSLMTIGGATAQQLFDSMGMDGKVVMFGSTGGREVCFNLSIGVRNLQLLSMSISTSPAFVFETMQSFREQALPLFASGALRPVVETVLPLRELERAHRMIDERAHFGKIIMEVPQE